MAADIIRPWLRARHLSLSLMLLCGLSVSAAAQQTGQPLKLVPPAQPQATPPAVPGQPGATVPPVASPSGGASSSGTVSASPSASSPPVTKQGFTVQKLSSVNPESAGLLGESEGGLGTNIWRDTPRSEAVRLIDNLPEGSPIPILHEIQRRLLLSIAEAPIDRTVPAPPPGSFLKSRLERLHAMGEGRDTRALQALSFGDPMESDEPDVVDQAFRLRLAAGEMAGACDLAANGLQRFPATAWQRRVVFCHALAGRAESAELGLHLLEETDSELHPAFSPLIQRLNGDDKIEIPAIDHVDLLIVAMVRAAVAGEAIPPEVTGSRLALVSLLDLSELAPESRLVIAESLYAGGVISAVEMTAIYLEFPDAGAEAAADEPAGRAHLFQLAANEANGAVKAEAALSFLSAAERAFGRPAGLRLTGEILTGLEPGQTVTWFAGTAIRALVASGRLETARPWMVLLQRYSPIDPELAARLREIGPLLVIAGMAEGADPMATANGLGADPVRWNALSLMQALDLPLPDTAWRGAVALEGTDVEPLAAPSPGLFYGFDAASHSLRVGEAVSLGLILAGDHSADTLSPITAALLIKGLARIGLVGEARRLAVDAALAQGL